MLGMWTINVAPNLWTVLYTNLALHTNWMMHTYTCTYTLTLAAKYRPDGSPDGSSSITIVRVPLWSFPIWPWLPCKGPHAPFKHNAWGDVYNFQGPTHPYNFEKSYKCSAHSGCRVGIRGHLVILFIELVAVGGHCTMFYKSPTWQAWYNVIWWSYSQGSGRGSRPLRVS